ncbi:hypothetical protein [Neptunicoccus cionae]|uniref:Uncharacterized protein n=1 Tax=Neptunicoccus cionae TaxID=2035344 RepID=A0A916QVX9_9RHOB|nr:hypothetical protein [Amylibacter cionae]GGA12346.1 hypothetical protein GCM10011498_10290 [Amylibacter cionae]
MNADLTLDHEYLEGAARTRRYFAKFEKIIAHLERVTDLSRNDGLVAHGEAEIIKDYLSRLSHTFSALSYKYLMTWRVSGALPNGMSVDRQESGFPVFQELLQMANDALNVEHHLKASQSPDEIKKAMVRHILNEQSHPTALQYALSQRLYYEALAGRDLFFAGNDPQAIWRGSIDDDRRRYLLHWASYDSQTNLPAVYMMELEDSGRTALVHDDRRWPQVQAHLMAQAVSGLKLVTIATGFDQDFDDLHPKKLRRIHIGPMYSHAYTEQTGPLRDVLAETAGQEGMDWALAWTVETLWSKTVTQEKTGWFSVAQREIFNLEDRGELTGATEQNRSLILPQRAYQVLKDRDPAGMRNVRKYVVGSGGRVASYN